MLVEIGVGLGIGVFVVLDAVLIGILVTWLQRRQGRMYRWQLMLLSVFLCTTVAAFSVWLVDPSDSASIRTSAIIGALVAAIYGLVAKWPSKSSYRARYRGR